MKFVFSSYVYTKEFNEPKAWLKRINIYTGILESLSKTDEVISIEQIDFEGPVKNNGVDYKFMRFSKHALRFFPWKLHQYIKTLKPDVIVVQGLHFPLQVIQLRLMLGFKVKIIVQNHAEKPFQGIKKLFQQLADHFINAYLFAAHKMGLEWVKAGNLASVKKIHEVMEVSSVFYPIERAIAIQHTGAAGDPVFLWVGRLNENKDPVTVVKAFLGFLDEAPLAKLYMIYHTTELLPEIKHLLAAKTAYTDAVKLIGSVPHDNLHYWFNSATYILSGSYYEGSGTSICEAMSCGCIPIVTNIPSFQMITKNGACGILYEPGNEQSLLTALKQTKELDIASKRNLSLAYFKTNLSFDAIAARFHEIASTL